MKIKNIALLVLCFALLSVPVLAQTSGSSTASITFLQGTLTLNEITNINFNTRTISATEMTYAAMEGNVYVNVMDLRGTGVGWRVRAAASRFNADTTPSLPGAQIILTNGEAISTQPEAAEPTVTQSIAIDCDGADSLDFVRAIEGTGLGTWSIEWNGVEGENANVGLRVPGGVATAGAHTATITWTLLATP